MTQEACTAFCDTGPFIFSGVEFGQECCMFHVDSSFHAADTTPFDMMQTAETLLRTAASTPLSPTAIWLARATPQKFVEAPLA